MSCINGHHDRRPEKCTGSVIIVSLDAMFVYFCLSEKLDYVQLFHKLFVLVWVEARCNFSYSIDGDVDLPFGRWTSEDTGCNNAR